MSGRFFTFLMLLFLLSCSAPSCSAASLPLILQSRIESAPLTGHLDILEDKSGKLTIEEVSSPALDGMFKPDNRPVPNFGITKSVYWARFSIGNDLKEKTLWLLELDFPHMDYLDFYLPRTGGGFDLMQAGDMRPMSIRNYRHRNPVFPVYLNASETTCYLRVDARGRTLMPLTLWTPEAFSRMDCRRGMINGGYFGAMLVMVAYNLFIFLTLRDRNYLYYVLDIFCFALFIFSSKGFLFEFFSGEMPGFNQYSALLVVPALLTGIVFGRSFLETARNTPAIDRILKSLFIVGLLSLPAYFVMPPEVWKRIMAIVVALSSIAGLMASLACLRKDYHPARYFLAARGFRVVGVFTVTLGMNNILPMNQLTPFSLQIGSLLEVVFLSFALADRIAVLRYEKEEAQTNALRSSHLAALGELAAGVAHEINTPVNTIINSADLLLEDSDRKTLEHDVEIIKKEGRRIATIAQSLLFFARRPALDKVPFAVAELLQGTLNMIGAKLRKENITVTIALPSDLMTVLVRPQQIEQVFLNVLTNAMHALDERHGQTLDTKFLEISAAEININGMQFVRVAFLDNGIGIAASLLHTVKETFVTTKAPGNGTGLGLSICQRIIGEHGGAIDIESRAGEYTRVSIDLPGDLPGVAHV
jgi:signal transduction histidine kinase